MTQLLVVPCFENGVVGTLFTLFAIERVVTRERPICCMHLGRRKGLLSRWFRSGFASVAPGLQPTLFCAVT